jgi:hypothetical protein
MRNVSFRLDKNQGEIVYAYFDTFGEHIQPFQKIRIGVWAPAGRVNFTPSAFLGEINEFIIYLNQDSLLVPE